MTATGPRTRGGVSGMGRSGGAGRGSSGFGRSADFTPVPRERRGRTVRRIAAFFRPYRWQVVVVMVSIIVTSLLGVINPYLLKLLLDVAIPQKDWLLLNLFVVLMIVIPIVSGIIGVGQTYVNNKVGQHVMQDLRDALYAHLQRMPLRFFTETRTGEIQSRLANDVGGVQSVVTDTASSVFSNIIIVFTTLLAMAWLDWRLTVISLLIMPFFMWLTYRVGRTPARGHGGDPEGACGRLRDHRGDPVRERILLAKTFGQQDESVRRFRLANAKLAALQLRGSLVGRWFFMLVGTIFSIMPAFVYWVAGVLTIQGDPNAPTAGDIVAFTTLQSRLFFPLGQLLSVQVEVQGALALFDRIFEYLDLEPEIEEPETAVVLTREDVRGRLRFRHVSFGYPRSSKPLAMGAAELATDTGGELDPSMLEALDGADRPEGIDAAADDAADTSEPSPSPSRTSTSRSSLGSSWRSSGRRARARRRRRISCPACTTWPRERSRSTASTCARSAWSSLGAIIGFVTQETISSTPRSARTSPTPSPTPPTASSRPLRAGRDPRPHPRAARRL